MIIYKCNTCGETTETADYFIELKSDTYFHFINEKDKVKMNNFNHVHYCSDKCLAEALIPSYAANNKVSEYLQLKEVSDKAFYDELARRNDLVEESHNRYRKFSATNSFSGLTTYTLTKLGFQQNK